MNVNSRIAKHIQAAVSLIVIFLGVVVVVFSLIDLIQVNKCTVCGDVILGKPERVKDTIPLCDRCYSEKERWKNLTSQ